MRSIRGSLENLQALIPVSVGRYGEPLSQTYRALIDTGATRTCITKRLIDALQLPPRGKLLVGSAVTAPERRYAHAYALGLYCISADTERSTLYVLDHEFVAPWFADNDNFDVLLGMDIISQGRLTFEPDGTFSFEFAF